MKKTHIVVSGPESTGKTRLAEELSKYYSATLVKEYSREYLLKYGPEYKREDLRKIAFGQFQNLLEANYQKKSLIISDTCLLTLLIWDEWKYGMLDDFISEWYGLQEVDYYLICYPDLPWEPDILRENENDLQTLFEIYESRIKATNIPYSIIMGSEKNRFLNAKSIMDNFLET